MAILTFHHPPLSFPAHFDIPPDRTAWPDPQPYQNKTPNRPRAKFKNWKDALAPKTPIAKSLVGLHGVYILVFEHPHPAIFIGFTAVDTAIPDDILSSLKKHRVKVTGSHVGQTHGTTGGVEHTKIWSDFAGPRYRRSRAHGTEADLCEDVRFTFATLDAPDPPSAKDLKGFEYALSQGVAHRAVLKLFWPMGVPRVLPLSPGPARVAVSGSHIRLPGGIEIAL